MDVIFSAVFALEASAAIIQETLEFFSAPTRVHCFFHYLSIKCHARSGSNPIKFLTRFYFLLETSDRIYGSDDDIVFSYFLQLIKVKTKPTPCVFQSLSFLAWV